jgi:hypothetical protein
MQTRPPHPNSAISNQLPMPHPLGQFRPVGRPPAPGTNTAPLVIQGLHGGTPHMVRPGGQPMLGQLAGVPVMQQRIGGGNPLTPEQVQQLLLRRATNMQYPSMYKPLHCIA